MSERETSRLPGVWTLIRDVGSFLAGWTLIFMEVSRSEVRESVLVLAGSVIGVPGIWAGGAAVVDAVRGRQDGTGDSPSRPQGSADLPSS